MIKKTQRTAILPPITCCWAMIGIFFVILSACAHRPNRPPEEVLRSKVEKVWLAKANGDCLTVYMSMPASYRKMVSQDAFASRCFKTRLRNPTIVDMDMADDHAHAVVTVKFDVFQMGYWIPGAQIKEHWSKEGRNWVVDLRPDKGTPF
ncbi:MAG: hypothetical protein CSA23_02850 [Deltaproteobacteria bacterium]|nr:MAG: hypothetical protein CSA23_02850 [Deltaproteobacteria bacterium]